MSIWEDIEKHGGMPFYGFPAIPSIKDNKFVVDFPLGYKPNGSKTQEVGERMATALSGNLVSFNDKQVVIELGESTGYDILTLIMSKI
jgi:hypothetical protein